MFFESFSSEIILMVLSFGGFLIAHKIHKEKTAHLKTGKAMICPLEGHCEDVVTSDFSKMVGLPLEITGLFYYGLVFVVNLLFILIPSLKFSLLEIILYGISFFGFLFSVYLVFVQAAIIKNWCTWCLYSALFSTFIFISATSNFLSYQNQLIEVMRQNAWFFILANILAYALGTSLALVTEILTLRFLKDFKIDHQEKVHLIYLWQILWATIFIIIISSFTIFLFDLHVLESFALFKLKTIILAGIILASVILSWIILPKLSQNKIECTVINIKTVVFCRNLAILLSTFLLTSWLINLFVHQIFHNVQGLTKSLEAYGSIIIIVLFFTFIIFQISDSKKLDKQK